MRMFLSVSAAHIVERARKVCRDRVPTWTTTGVVMSHTYTESESHIQYDAAPGKPFQQNCPFMSLSVIFLLNVKSESEINIFIFQVCKLYFKPNNRKKALNNVPAEVHLFRP